MRLLLLASILVSAKVGQFALLDLVVVPVQRWTRTVPVPEEEGFEPESERRKTRAEA